MSLGKKIDFTFLQCKLTSSSKKEQLSFRLLCSVRSKESLNAGLNFNT